jgi:predicted RNase H-like HicB family nuclease
MQSIIKKDGKFYLNVEVQLIEQGDFIVAYCPSLELSSFGKTKKEAKTMFEEALDLFVKDTSDNNTFNSALLDLGWQLKIIPKPEFYPPNHTISTKVNPHLLSTFNERVLIPA